MKRLFFTLAALLSALGAFAQSADEIIARMDEVMSGSESEGLEMTLDIKIPILGTISSKSYTRGDKLRMETEAAGLKLIEFTDGDCMYTYNSSENSITIETVDLGKKAEGDAAVFGDIDDGYVSTITKETDTAWYIRAKKDKSNKDKDAPKTIDIVIAKGTYVPVSLSMSASGTKITMRDISIGVEESYVTYNPSDYPDAKVIDNRGKKKK